STLTQMVMNDSMSVNGVINGEADIDSVLTNPLFASKLNLDSLSMNNMPVGSLVLNVDNQQEDAFDIDLQLTGNGNDLRTKGIYSTAGEGQFNFDVGINALSMATLQPLSFGQIEDAEGKITGDLKVSGTTDVPQVNGDI